MASGGGGTGKVSSGPLKGKVVYLAESEIAGLAKAAGLTYTDAFLAMKAGNNPVIQAGVQFLADTGAKTAKTSLTDKIAATVEAKAKAQQAAAAAEATKAQQLAGGALVAQELNGKIAGKATNVKQVVANPDGTYTLYTKQGNAITYDSAAKVASVVDAFTGAASATPVAAPPAEANGTPKPKASPTQATGTSTVNPAEYAALGLPAPAETLSVEKNKTITVQWQTGPKEITGDVYGSQWVVQKDGSSYNITLASNGQWLTSVPTKGEAAAAIHSLMGPDLAGKVDWASDKPLNGLDPEVKQQIVKIKNAADLAKLKEIKAAQKGLKTPKAPTADGDTPAAPKAPKAGSLANYEGFSPSSAAPTVEQTAGSTYMTVTYQGFPSKGFNVPDMDPVTLTYPNGKTATIKAVGATPKSANTKLTKWYSDWAKSNGPGTSGYHFLNNRYQSPAYRAMNMYLRWKGQGKSDAEIDTLLKTDTFVTYKGTIFNKYAYGNYPGIEQEYTAAGMAKVIAGTDKALAGAPLPETTVMYRGISRGTKDNPNPIATEIFKAKPGDILSKDDAYQSITANKNHALNYATKPHLGGPGVMMTVVLPKGTKGAYLPANGGVTSEYEYLLSRGAQYRLLSKKTDQATGLIHAVVELVGQD